MLGKTELQVNAEGDYTGLQGGGLRNCISVGVPERQGQANHCSCDVSPTVRQHLYDAHLRLQGGGGCEKRSGN
jgi:hypothetical protein